MTVFAKVDVSILNSSYSSWWNAKRLSMLMKWHQLFSFGNGTINPRSSIHASLPLHMARQQEKKDKQLYQHLCLGEFGRGNANESEWKTINENEDWDPWEYDDDERSCDDIEKY